MQKTGFSDFINKHGKIIFPMFCISMLLIFVLPMFWLKDSIGFTYFTFYYFAATFITIFTGLKYSYDFETMHGMHLNESFGQYLQNNAGDIALHIFWSLLFWATIVCMIVLLVKYFKKHTVSKPCLIIIPIPYIIAVLIYCIAELIPFIGFFLALILEVLAIMYCANFQHFPTHRTKAQRIADLERQIAELQEQANKKDAD